MLVVPLQVPLRNVLEAHTVFVQAVHLPWLVAPEPARYSSRLQLGWSRHAPFLVLLAPERKGCVAPIMRMCPRAAMERTPLRARKAQSKTAR